MALYWCNRFDSGSAPVFYCKCKNCSINTDSGAFSIDSLTCCSTLAIRFNCTQYSVLVHERIRRTPACVPDMGFLWRYAYSTTAHQFIIIRLLYCVRYFWTMLSNQDIRKCSWYSRSHGFQCFLHIRVVLGSRVMWSLCPREIDTIGL